MPSAWTLPQFQHVRLESSDLTDLAPTEYRADAVITLAAADTSVLAVVVEAQLGRDKNKQWTWPVYLATLRARLKCPAVLLVVCVDARTRGLVRHPRSNSATPAGPCVPSCWVQIKYRSSPTPSKPHALPS